MDFCFRDDRSAIRQAGLECFRCVLHGLNFDALESVVCNMLTAITSPITYQPSDLDVGERSALLLALPAALETHTQAILSTALSTALTPPIDLSKLRILSSVTAVRSSATFMNNLSRVLSGIIEFNVDFIESMEAPQCDSLISTQVIKDTEIIKQEVVRAANSVFKRVPDNDEKNVLDLITQTLLPDYIPIGDFSVAGMYKIRAKLIEIKAITDETILDKAFLQSNSALVEKKCRGMFYRVAILHLVDLFIQAVPNENVVALLPQLFRFIVPMALCDPSILVRCQGFEVLATLSSIMKRNDAIGDVIEVRGVTQTKKGVVKNKCSKR